MSQTPIRDQFHIGFVEGYSVGTKTSVSDIKRNYSGCLELIKLHYDTWEQNLQDIKKFRNYGNYWGELCGMLDVHTEEVLSDKSTKKLIDHVRHSRIPYAKEYLLSRVSAIQKKGENLSKHNYGKLLELKHVLSSK